MAKNVIIVAGNIGAGKSTLVNYLKQKGNFLCVPEFIDKTWRDHFYSDRKSYTAYFEKSCLMARVARHITAKKHNGIVIFDRGLIEAREVFVQNSHDEGFLSFKNLNSYDHDLREAIDSLGRTEDDAKQWMESLIVYLKAPPKVCFERQFNRNKTQDKTGKEIIPLEYFERIHKYYERFISNSETVYRKWGLPNRPKILIIDASLDKSKDPQYLETITKKIRDALGIRDMSVQKKLNVPRKSVAVVAPVVRTSMPAAKSMPQLQQKKPNPASGEVILVQKIHIPNMPSVRPQNSNQNKNPLQQRPQAQNQQKNLLQNQRLPQHQPLRQNPPQQKPSLQQQQKSQGNQQQHQQPRLNLQQHRPQQQNQRPQPRPNQSNGPQNNQKNQKR